MADNTKNQEDRPQETDGQLNRLTSLLPHASSSGGLQPRSGQYLSTDEASMNQTARGSLLGLDKRAEEKKREKQQKQREEDDRRSSFPRKREDQPRATFKPQRKQKQYRKRAQEEISGSERAPHHIRMAGANGNNKDRYDKNRRNQQKSVDEGRDGGHKKTHKDDAPLPYNPTKRQNNASLDRPAEDKNVLAYDSEGSEFDRQFYLADEGGYVVDASEMESQGQLGRFLFVNDKIRAREKEMEERRRNGKTSQQSSQRYSARQSALMDDQEAWEENRLLSSGAASRGAVDLDVSTDNDTRVTLLVHQLKPPFLEKSSVGLLGKQSTAATVKDNSSDFCKMAREGSATLQRLRQEKDKNTMRQKFWELGGTKMGNAMRVVKEETLEPDSQVSQSQDDDRGEVDYKKSTGYASHMVRQKKEAVSTFAKTKSLRQQREFLPIFSVRDELLSTIRENNVVVSVFSVGIVLPFLSVRFTALFLHHRLLLEKQAVEVSCCGIIFLFIEHHTKICETQI